ncbi:PREDICTED: IQ domain-containing protein G-like [Ceratosolen solmsi marchali]|uniref:IQ domain-containing protein G-like n=1 Tax=Ceratosolen solmsi marchali TaxID=326594 RepID=A0AAJ6YKY4_9HYME|nr:PREDICTED: IQ domain-containing protein G-like [Ceratosolen solmsi marchali]
MPKSRPKNEKEGLRLKSDMELEYVDAWLSSRREQDDLRMMESCDLLEAKLSDCRKRETGELLVSKNIRAFLKLTTEKYVKDSYVWMERQQTEMKSYDEEIRRLQEEIGKKRATLEELYKEYTSKQEFIDGCLAEKEAARKKREHEDHVRRQTIRIQAWWRGVMVRRKLGPYRPEDKKRKRPNKSKK